MKEENVLTRLRFSLMGMFLLATVVAHAHLQATRSVDGECGEQCEGWLMGSSSPQVRHKLAGEKVDAK